MKYQAKSVLVLILAFALGISAKGQQNQSPSEFVATVMTQALSENGTAPKLQRVLQSSRDVRRVVSTHLSPKLLTQVLDVSGKTYQFEESSRNEEVSVIVLRYSSADVCGKMNKVLEPLKNYFGNSKILTKFSAAQLGSLLVITFSENSGDARITSAIESLPNKFAATTRDHDHPWVEGK